MPPVSIMHGIAYGINHFFLFSLPSMVFELFIFYSLYSTSNGYLKWSVKKSI